MGSSQVLLSTSMPHPLHGAGSGLSTQVFEVAIKKQTNLKKVKDEPAQYVLIESEPSV